MCKFVLLAGAAAALSFAAGAAAQTARLDVQVSNDNVNWSDSLFAPAGSQVFVRIVASTTAPNARGLANLTFQPTLSNWTTADTRMFFTTSSGAPSADNGGLPANIGRMSPYGALSMAAASTPGLLTSFSDPDGRLRFAGARATAMTTDLSYGVVCNQNPKVSYPPYSQSVSAVVFKYGVQLSGNTTLRSMIADVPVAGIKNGAISWYSSITTSSGSPFNTPLTQADIDPATIFVGPPNTPPTANNDAFNMLEDQSLFVTTGSVLSNDTDPDAEETLTAELVATAAHGTLEFNANGTFSYIPVADYNGIDTFTYRVRDRYNAASNVATVTINVADINDEPVFTASNPADTMEDAGARTITNWASFNPGSGETQGVAQYEVVSVSNPNLFAMGGWPLIDTSGTLRFTPASNTSGSATFVVRVRDTGGTDNGGVNTSSEQAFSLNVMPVNDAPSVTTAPIAPVGEDAGQQSLAGWASFNAGPNEADQVLLGYSVSAISNASLFTVPPTVAPDGTLVFTPAPNAVGTSTFTLTARDSGGTAHGGVDTSAPQVLTINIVPVNDAPTFAAVNPPAVNEDVSAQSISNWAAFNAGGGPAESSQSVLAYTVTDVTNPALFAVPPSVSTSGALTYTLAPNAFGTSSFTVRVRDNGGQEAGGVDTSAPQAFTVTANPVNDAPSFVAASSVPTTEDAGPQSVAGFAQFNAGPGESSQGVLAYTISSFTNPSLFTAAPTVAADGTLSYTTAPNASGTSTFQLRVRDNGGTVSGGVDTSAPQTITISVTAVNDAPTVALNTIPTILEDSGARSVTSFASFGAGPGESSQSLVGYTVSGISDPAMFLVPPSVSNIGTLTYTPAANASGTVTFAVQARDNGGTASGGVDTSAPVLATINITPVNDAPGFAAANPPIADEDAGTQTIANWASFVGGPNEGDQAVLSYTVSNVTNASLFAVQPAVAANGTLTFTPAANASGTANFSVRVRDNGGVTNGGVDTSSIQTFTVTVSAVNDAPSVAVNTIPTIVEDGGPQSVSGFASFNPGPGESGQSLAGYTVGNISNPAMFASGPSVANNGTLTYTPSSNASGSVTFTVTARDNGGTSGGGVDTSAPVLATINITNVNDAPTFAAANPASNEDAGTVTLAGWAAFNPGPFEDGQTAEYQVTSTTNAALFAPGGLPAISPTGTLSYATAENASGTATFTARVRDNGGTASGGVDLSAPQVFTITVNAVNDAPIVTVGSAPVIEEDAPAQVVPGFAAFQPGPGESGQSLVEYLVSGVSNPAAFTVPPAINNAGTLTYTPAPDASGTISFIVRGRDNGGTTNGGVELSQPVEASLNINGVNDPPVAVARDITVDARTSCVSLLISPAQIDNGSRDPDNGPAELNIRINRTGEFPVGVTPVILTVTDPAGLTSTAQANVTVLANDANRNTVPDSCDLIRGGGGPDCDDDGDSDESQCVWDNGAAAPMQSTINGQLSQYGGTIAHKVVDDIYLQPGLLYRLTSFRGQILTNSIERGARLEFYRDCDGGPAGEPFATFETTNVASETPGANDKMLVTYVFEFCDEKFVLEGGEQYWISLQGKVNCNTTDQAFWAIVGTEADPTDMIGSVPYKNLGTGDHPCTEPVFGEWETIADCCIGCANMSFSITGSACQIIWDNGNVDLGPTKGGDPSGINRGIFSRAADNLVVKPCRTETICWIEAYIWTNCTPVFGFLEIYDNSCNLPTGGVRHRAIPTDIVELDETLTIDGDTYRLVKLEFWNITWTLEGGRNYWLSVGADGAGSFNARSFFAYSEPDSPCGCEATRIVKGAKLANRQSDTRWLRAQREYAFRIATKPFFMDPVVTNIPPSRSCPQDANEDGLVDLTDLFFFLNEWFVGCP